MVVLWFYLGDSKAALAEAEARPAASDNKTPDRSCPTLKTSWYKAAEFTL
jgi:hypothetical protein